MHRHTTKSFEQKSQLAQQKKQRCAEYSRPIAQSRQEYLRSLHVDRLKAAAQAQSLLQQQHDLELQWQRQLQAAAKKQRQEESKELRRERERTRRYRQKKEEEEEAQRRIEIRDRLAEHAMMDEMLENNDHPMHRCVRLRKPASRFVGSKNP